MGNEKISRSKITVRRDYKINDNVSGHEQFFSPDQVYKPVDSDGSLYWHVLDRLKINDDGEPEYNMITINESYVKDWDSIPAEVKVNYKDYELVETFDHEPTGQELYDLIPMEFRQDIYN